VHVGQEEQQQIIEGLFVFEFPLQDKTETKGEQNAQRIVPADHSVFVEEVIPEWEQDLCKRGKGSFKEDDPGNGSGYEAMHHLYISYLVGKFGKDPQKGIPGGGMPLVSFICQQLGVAVTGFGYIPAVHFVAPQFMMYAGI
jgi:hypothetical protein